MADVTTKTRRGREERKKEGIFSVKSNSSLYGTYV